MTLELLPPKQSVIGFPVTAVPFDYQIELILKWAKRRLSKVVCVANVHMLMEAHRNPQFAAVLSNADLVTPDGMPLVWLMNLLGVWRQNRVAGMDILLALCHQVSVKKISVFFVGSERETLDRMRVRLQQEFPQLQIAGMEPLPFRPLNSEEDADIIEKINSSEAGIVFVSLGCPKQEIWMSEHQGKINTVMLGLGGVFPVYAGLHKWAPLWVRKLGLEWLYRLVQEPRRLWKRYYQTIPPFLYLALKQLVTVRPCSLGKDPFKETTKTSKIKSSVPQNPAISNHQS
ncbi:MAG: WecB/TagA/CpsF family glycosyltransferase [Timaviella obliquedivisa GSE-PSE-MK23-08B]|jgi:N-acetylglucosaminyldiphosphoundecaprenol N-acetyl-beta-D-mannosaminyltransferase|nr:WecB/TagA/CpsF family glycosyltransferase [Timaviella obliquedivisa GSE-PSE-MK23-08B]